MKSINKLACVIGLAGVALAANAQVYTFTEELGVDYTYEQGQIPDGGSVPARFNIDTTDVNGSLNQMNGTLNTNSFRVYLNLEGDPQAVNSDIYITLTAPQQDDGSFLTATIVNRPGFGVGGYADSGFNVTLFDGTDPNHSSYTDIHWYQNDTMYTAGQAITGTYKSDGRSITPDDDNADLYVSASRDSSLAIFQGINPNGEWNLAVFDMGKDQGFAVLKSWGLDFTPIPEPQQYAMVVGAGLMAFGFYRNRMRKNA